MTTQRAALISFVASRAFDGLTTTAADANRALWGRPGHSATYGVVSRAIAAGLLTATRRGNAHLLSIPVGPSVKVPGARERLGQTLGL